MLIKFLTLNLLDGGIFFDNITLFLKKEAPDIAVFQEVYNGQDPSLEPRLRTIARLQETLPDYQYHFAPTATEILDGKKVPFGNAIFSRFPITGSNIIFYDIPYDPHYVKANKKGDFSKDPCNVQCVTLSVNGQGLHVFNTHGVWGLDGTDNERRFRMSEVIVSQIQNVAPAILAGDFNTQPRTLAMQRIEEHLVNVFRNELVSTFNMRHKTNPGYGAAVVDYIFVSPNIKVLDKACPDDDVSDHKPLLVTLEI